MNKYDIILVITIFLLGVIGYFYVLSIDSSDDLIAIVTYDSNVVLEIDLSIDDIYVIDAYLGDVVIEVLDNKIRVVEENSPLNICSNMGFIDNVRSIIVCLPNKVMIELKNKYNNLDELDVII